MAKQVLSVICSACKTPYRAKIQKGLLSRGCPACAHQEKADYVSSIPKIKQVREIIEVELEDTSDQED